MAKCGQFNSQSMQSVHLSISNTAAICPSILFGLATISRTSKGQDSTQISHPVQRGSTTSILTIGESAHFRSDNSSLHLTISAKRMKFFLTDLKSRFPGLAPVGPIGFEQLGVKRMYLMEVSKYSC